MRKGQVCQNLHPNGFELLQPGQRAVIFAVASEVRDEATGGCQPCLLIWRAVTLLKHDWTPKQLEIAVELWLSPNKPITLFFRPRGSLGVYLDIYANDGSSLPSIGHADEVQESSGSAAALGRATGWLAECTKNHQWCSHPDNEGLPARVLDLGLSDDHAIRLIDTFPSMGPYMALSYCWGKDQTLTTTQQTIAGRRSGIESHALPRTYQDAVTIARFLGIRYLWIDALCIIQGDAEDWANESAKMCSTYENAYLTVSADVSPSASAGIFSRQAYAEYFRLMEYQGTQIYARKYLGQLHSIVEPSNNLDDKMPLYRRAWTLQESVLSTRTLMFTGRELVWECNEAYHCECGNQKLSTMDFTNRVFRKPRMLKDVVTKLELTIKWNEFVQKFTQQELSHPTDKLVAISGLAKKMQHVYHEITGLANEYMAGLWLNSLTQDLLWQMADEASDDGSVFAVASIRQAEWRAPTWSWASMDGRAVPQPPRTLIKQFELLQYHRKLASDDPTGQLLEASLTLRGRLVEVKLVPVQERPWDHLQGRVQGRRLGVRARSGENDYPFVPDEPHLQLDSGEAFFCFLVATYEELDVLKFTRVLFLVLKASAQEPGAFERVGVNFLGNDMEEHAEEGKDGLGRHARWAPPSRRKKHDLFEGVDEVVIKLV